MAKIVSITEHFRHFLTKLKESFWGDLEQKTQLAWKRFLEEESERERDRFAVLDNYQRGPHPRAIPQRVLREGVAGAFWHHSAAHFECSR